MGVLLVVAGLLPGVAGAVPPWPGAGGAVPLLFVLLALWGGFSGVGGRAPGVLLGVAGACQPGALLFVPLLWCAGRRKAVGWAPPVFAGCSALAWVSAPGAAGAPWVSWAAWAHSSGSGPGFVLGPAPVTGSAAAQSLAGVLSRLGADGPAGVLLFLPLAAAVCGYALSRAVRLARDGQPLLAVGITGCAAAAVCPSDGRQQVLWLLLTLSGRAGCRRADRRVWPVAVVLVAVLPGSVLLPNLALLTPLREAPLTAACLVAACAVRFLPRSSPYWTATGPAVPLRPSGGGRTGRWSLPLWWRPPTRPHLLLELLLIRVGYSLYSHIRAAAPAGRTRAEDNGTLLLAVERVLGIDVERTVNHAVAARPWLEVPFDFYYTSFHFVVPLTVLGVLYVRAPAAYRWARTGLGLATLLALAGFWLFPLAPPRLMPGLGFIDTVHGPQDLANPQYGPLTALSNQYAAMPSLHFGWSLWCGLVVVALAPRTWQKLLGVLHPLITVCAIVATANHWVLDAVGGAAVVAAGFALVRILSGPRSGPPGVGPGRVSLPAPRAGTGAGERRPQPSTRR
ncbi:bifunctional glycosyltransferase 87/phosphatase PAP2 family protein [Streptomyces sp. NPDC097619]|uniref:bifunctional glycosyltransferase 87/phosphatase PAP2 family protein n=1 Tax=Streptomyces sp. NPDC097619 TaxID=3157228 RepID=UPI00332EC39A